MFVVGSTFSPKFWKHIFKIQFVLKVIVHGSFKTDKTVFIWFDLTIFWFRFTKFVK